MKKASAILMAMLTLIAPALGRVSAQSTADSGTGTKSGAKTREVPSPRAARLAAPENRLSLYLLDAAVPGYASFSFGDYWAGSLFAAGRAATLILGLRARNEHLEYRSLEKAARTAEAVYGPGLRFADPFSGGFRTASELGRSADRRAALMSLSLTLHLALIVGSLVYTAIRAGEINSTRLPVFDRKAGGDGLSPVFALDSDAGARSPDGTESPREGDIRLRVELIRLGF